MIITSRIEENSVDSTQLLGQMKDNSGDKRLEEKWVAQSKSWVNYKCFFRTYFCYYLVYLHSSHLQLGLRSI